MYRYRLCCSKRRFFFPLSIEQQRMIRHGHRCTIPRASASFRRIRRKVARMRDPIPRPKTPTDSSRKARALRAFFNFSFFFFSSEESPTRDSLNGIQLPSTTSTTKQGMRKRNRHPRCERARRQEREKKKGHEKRYIKRITPSRIEK